MTSPQFVGLPNPLFKCFGSKFQSSKHYPFPEHSRIIEPFAGGAGYSCRYYQCKITLVEKDPDIALLWRWLISVDPSEVLRLPTAIPIGTDIRTLDCSRGGQELIRRWQRVGRSDCWTISKWNGMPGLWGETTRSHVARNVEKIRHWIICEGDYSEVANVEATWFIDAPYQHVPVSYAFWMVDYGELGDWVYDRMGQVIVCEQQGADWLPFKPACLVRSGRTHEGGTRNESNEVMYVNSQTTGVSLSPV
jgi:hypothetical protein